MKLGLIIIFYNNESALTDIFFDKLLNITESFELCVVNNGSNDATFEKLVDLKDLFESNITVVDIKRNQSLEMAIKAGARYLLNKVSLKHIGYICLEDFKTIDNLNALLEVLKQNKQLIVEHNTKAIKNKQLSRVLVKNIFSILDYFNRLKIDYDNTSGLQHIIS